MKSIILSIVFFFAVFTAISYSQLPTSSSESDVVYEQIEQNYLAGLNSNVPGLKVSSAYFLGEMKSEKALFPLMTMFRQETNDGAKLVIAWSLLKIGDQRGVYLVKSYIDSGDCDEIRCMLQHLYMDYSLKTYGKLVLN